MKYKLKKPVDFEGTTYKELDLDFDSLTGLDILTCSTSAQALAEEQSLIYNPMDEVNSVYFVAVAAKAAGVPPDMLLQMSGVDFTAIVMQAKNVLMGGMSPSDNSS